VIAMVFWVVSGVLLRDVPIRYDQDRYRLRSSHFCGIGYRSDEADPNPILCVYYYVIVKPHRRHKNIL